MLIAQHRDAEQQPGHAEQQHRDAVQGLPIAQHRDPDQQHRDADQGLPIAQHRDAHQQPRNAWATSRTAIGS